MLKSQMVSPAQVTRELVLKNPQLAACAKNKLGAPGGEFHILYYLAAEEMGVDLIHYQYDQGDGHWYQILNPYSIDHLRLISKP
ncbi:MAG: hypothetical protein H7301_13585 [Cryobacterium sp.]|nr:hypothetical protein [Oligoflexia bacterium]